MYPSQLFANGPAAVFIVVLMAVSNTSSACVRFDVADTAVCVDVTALPDHNVPRSDYRLLRLDLDVSAFVQFQQSTDLAQFVYVIELPERRARIVDYSPQTEMVTDISGTQSISTHSESTASVGLKATANLGGYGTASGDISNGGRETDAVNFERLPEKHLLAASGTLDRGAAVYFKLKPSSQTTLEGSKRLSIVIEVPNSWRADYLRVRCAAYSVSRSLESGRPICGSMSFLVGIHQQGDHLGFQQARELIASERHLRNLAASFEDQISEEANTDVADLLLAVFRKPGKRPVPKNWVDAIIYDRSVSRTYPFERHLPDEVREAVSAFRTARTTLELLDPASSSG